MYIESVFALTKGKAMESRAFFPGFHVAVALLVALSCAATILPGQSDPASPRSFPQYPDPNTPRELVYPYYSLRDGSDSTLYLLDRAAWMVEFTVAVHSLSGQTAWSKPMTIHPDETTEINVKKLLGDLGVDYRGDFLEGSLSIHFKGRGNPLGGRMMVVGPKDTLNIGPVWTKGESGQNMVPDRLDTLWHDLGGARDLEMTVSNITGNAVDADFYLDFAGKRHAAPPLHFASHETKHVSLAEVLAGMKLTAYQAPSGGLSIVARGKPSLVAQGILTDPDTGGRTALQFRLPQLELKNALHASGIPLGVPSADSPFAGTGNFNPHIYLRNLLDSEQTVTLTVEYPGEGGPQQTPLPPFVVPGFTTKEVPLDSYYSLLPLPVPYCALRIQYNGPPGTVLAEINVMDENGDVADAPVVVNEGNGYAGSLSSHWGFDEKLDFLVFLTNMGDKECPVGFRLKVGSVVYYLTDLKLMPHETKVINLRKLRDRQQPDFRGNLIPASATQGTLSFIRLHLVPIMGRVMRWPRSRAEGPSTKQRGTSHQGPQPYFGFPTAG